MTKGNYPYPEDEFDAAPGPDAPIGVHRAPRTWWSRWWPFVAVLVVVPVVTVGAVLWTSSWDGLGGSGTDEALVDVTDDATDAATEGEDAATDPAAEETASEEAPVEEPAAPVVNFEQAVDVLNAANRNGLAADVKEQLETAGFTTVTAGNGSASTADVTTVFYASADLQPTAQAVADALGITTVTESATDAGSGVVVLLRSDFAG